MTQATAGLAALGLLGAVAVALVLSPARRGMGGDHRPPGRAMGTWIGVVALLGLMLPLAAVGVDASAGRSATVGVALLAGLLVQLLCEGVVTRSGRPDSRAWLGLVFSLARCGQVLLLWSTAPIAAGAVTLVVASVLWPVNFLVLCGVLGSRWRARAALT